MSTFVEKLLGSINTITGGIVSFGPPVGVIVDAHFVKSAAPKSTIITVEIADVICCVIFLRVISLLLCFVVIIAWYKWLSCLIGEWVYYTPAICCSRLTPCI